MFWQVFFAELGATVQKFENALTNGDVTRSWKLPTEPVERPYSAYYCSVNWHKQTQLVDLQSQGDNQRVLDEIKNADIVISNFKKSSAQKLGFDYEAIFKINPTIIYGQITGYGDEEEIPAFDVVLQADTGFMYMNGEPNGQPQKMPVALIDILAAHQLKEGILIALLKKNITGKGSYVTVSLVNSALASLANQATNWLMEQHIPQPLGTTHPNIAPYGELLKGIDGKVVVLAVGSDKQFEHLCKALKTDLFLHPSFATNHLRVKHRTLLIESLQSSVGERSGFELLNLLREHQVPCSLIKNMEEVFADENNKKLVLEEQMTDSYISKRVKTSVFQIK